MRYYVDAERQAGKHCTARTHYHGNMTWEEAIVTARYYARQGWAVVISAMGGK